MSLTCNTQFANTSFLFENFGYSIFFDSWKWKLDPYRISSDTDANVTIRQDLQNESKNPEELLQDEVSGFFRRQVLRTADAGTMWQYIRSRDKSVYLQYTVSPDYRLITLHTDRTETAGHIAFEYLGQMMPSVLLNFKTLTFHGVLIEHEGRGIIISAPSGVGKTTHARLWRDNKRAIIINGDRATCQKVDGVWTGFGLPWSGTSGEQINRSVPITALVVLERGEQNEAHPINGMEAFGAIWPHVQYPCWDEALTGKALELTDDFLGQIPIIRLHCRPDVDSVEVLNRALEEL